MYGSLSNSSSRAGSSAGSSSRPGPRDEAEPSWSATLVPVCNPDLIGDKIVLPKRHAEPVIAAAVDFRERVHRNKPGPQSEIWPVEYINDSASARKQSKRAKDKLFTITEKTPLSFLLRNTVNNTTVYAGVQGYYASPGTVQVSPWLATHLKTARVAKVRKLPRLKETCNVADSGVDCFTGRKGSMVDSNNIPTNNDKTSSQESEKADPLKNPKPLVSEKPEKKKSGKTEKRDRLERQKVEVTTRKIHTFGFYNTNPLNDKDAKQLHGPSPTQRVLHSNCWRYDDDSDGSESKVELSEQRLQVTLLPLPVGKYVQVRQKKAREDRPLFPQTEWGPIIAHFLRQQRATLTKGTVLSFKVPELIFGAEFVVESFSEYTESCASYDVPTLPEGICVPDENLAVEVVYSDKARNPVDNWKVICGDDIGKFRYRSGELELRLFEVKGVLVSEYIGDITVNQNVDCRITGWKPLGEHRGTTLVVEMREELPVSEFVYDMSPLEMYAIPVGRKYRQLARYSSYIWRDEGSLLGMSVGAATRLRIDSSHEELEESEGIRLSVFYPRYTRLRHPTRRCSLLIKVVQTGKETETKMPDEQTKRCGICRMLVPRSHHSEHKAACKKVNYSCSRCAAVIFNVDDLEEAENQHWHCSIPDCAVKGMGSTKHACGFGEISKQRHLNIYHTTANLSGLIFQDEQSVHIGVGDKSGIDCAHCMRYTFDSIHDWAKHRTTDCPARLITCRLCKLDVHQGAVWTREQWIDNLDQDKTEYPDFPVVTPVQMSTMKCLYPHEIVEALRTMICGICKAKVITYKLLEHLMEHREEMKGQVPPGRGVCLNRMCGNVLVEMKDEFLEIQLSSLVHKTQELISSGARLPEAQYRISMICGLITLLCGSCMTLSDYPPEPAQTMRLLQETDVHAVLEAEQRLQNYYKKMNVKNKSIQKDIPGCRRSWCRNWACATGRRKVTLKVDSSASAKVSSGEYAGVLMEGSDLARRLSVNMYSAFHDDEDICEWEAIPLKKEKKKKKKDKKAKKRTKGKDGGRPGHNVGIYVCAGNMESQARAIEGRIQVFLTRDRVIPGAKDPAGTAGTPASVPAPDTAAAKLERAELLQWWLVALEAAGVERDGPGGGEEIKPATVAVTLSCPGGGTEAEAGADAEVTARVDWAETKSGIPDGWVEEARAWLKSNAPAWVTGDDQKE